MWLPVAVAVISDSYLKPGLRKFRLQTDQSSLPVASRWDGTWRVSELVSRKGNPSSSASSRAYSTFEFP